MDETPDASRPSDEADDGRHRHRDDPPGPGRGRRWAFVTGAAALAVVVGGAGLILAGGGGGGGGGGEGGGTATTGEAGASAQEEIAARFEYARCMRDQGIEEFPDPVVEADGSIMFDGLSRLGVPEEQLRAAQSACEPLMAEQPGEGGPGGGGPGGGAAVQEIEPAAAGWEEVVPGGDCRCADGSDYSFFTREASPDKVVFYLDAGGACWSAETCAPGGDNEYQQAVDGPDGEGIFAFADDRNPLADHSFVYAPYCTGDVHLGNATTAYGPDLSVEHRGYVNGTAALDHLAATFPDAREVVVVGLSAGAVAAPLYGGLASDRFPDARVTVIADSSGAYPEVPEITGTAAAVWGTGNAIPDWPENAGVTAEEWSSFPGLFVRSGRHDPDIVFARHDYAYDEEQAAKLSLIGAPADDLVALIDANEARVEGAGVDLAGYVAPGDHHTALNGEAFYAETVEGVALVDWVTALVEGEPVDDVHCTDCAAG